MKARSSQKYSLGDIITKLVNKKLNPLTQRRKLFSSRKPSTSSFQDLDLIEYQSLNRNQAAKCQKYKSQLEGGSICLADLEIYHDPKRNYSRLFQSSKVYSNVISNRVKNKEENPQKTIEKKQLLSAYITRKQNSGELQKYLRKTNSKMANLFRETFMTLKERQKKSNESTSPSLFYLTVRSKDKVPLKLGDSKISRRNALGHGKSLYQTFYK